jgi:UDP-glucose 4-epimerase
MIAVIENPQAHGELFNVGHTQQITIHNLAILVKEATKSESDIVFVPYEQAYEKGFEDMPHRLPDISKLQRLIGYQPTLELPEMLERIIAYERQRTDGG